MVHTGKRYWRRTVHFSHSRLTPTWEFQPNRKLVLVSFLTLGCNSAENERTGMATKCFPGIVIDPHIQTIRPLISLTCMKNYYTFIVYLRFALLCWKYTNFPVEDHPMLLSRSFMTPFVNFSLHCFLIMSHKVHNTNWLLFKTNHILLFWLFRIQFIFSCSKFRASVGIYFCLFFVPLEWNIKTVTTPVTLGYYRVLKLFPLFMAQRCWAFVTLFSGVTSGTTKQSKAHMFHLFCLLCTLGRLFRS